MSNTVAIIPARGGSKRIPRKNIRFFCGKPIIGYSIETALKSGLFDRVIVSTDDEAIAEVARAFGAETPFLRPEELADDMSGTGAVIKHCLQWLMEAGCPVDYACCIYATAPFLREEFLQKGYDRLRDSGKSYAFSVTSFPFPIQRAIRINNEENVEAIFPENNTLRSQDLEKAFHDAGQFYWGKSEAFMHDEVMFSDVSVPVVLPRYLVQDIDTFEDWERAELMYKAILKDITK
jgi:pseudaminic acid cytidylyltransferase